jgi:prolipoprotein diacylglyceryl transferase
VTNVLAYFPSPSQGVWHLGPVPIRAYALFIIAGIVVALLIGDRRWEARGGERGVIYDIALWAVPFGLIGGRLYHLATDWRTYWGPGGAGLGAAVRIWDGGLGIWGAVALGGVGAWIGCRRRGIPLPAFGDALAPGIILAQAIGRLGNYFNQELYGRETTLPWGLEIFYRRDPSGYIDPHSLDGISTGQIAFVYADRRFNLGHGRLFALYVAGYCVGRFCVELLRDDTATHIAGIRINSFTSTFVFIGAMVYLMAAPKGREDPESLRGNQYLDEGAADAEADAEAATVATATTATVAVAASDTPVGSADSAQSAEADESAADAEANEPVPGSTEAAVEAEPSETGADEPEAETEAEEVEAEAPEAEAEAPEAEAEAAAQDSGAGQSEVDEPGAEAGEPEVEAAAAEGDEPESDEPETGPEGDEPDAASEEEPVDGDSDEEPDTETAETAEAAETAGTAETAEPEKSVPDEAVEPTPAQPDSRRRWGSRLRKRLSGR